MNVALLGCGTWGRNIARVLNELGSLHAICDPKADTAAFDCKQYTDERQVFDDLYVDAVAIATPTREHLSHAILALEAGKHVFIEKPIAASWDETLLLATRARETNLTVMVGHLLLYHPGFRAMKDAMDAVGPVRHMNSLRTASIRATLEDRGVVWDMAPHDVALAIWLTGEVPPRPYKVEARGHKHAGSALVDWGDWSLSCDYSWVTPVKRREFLISGAHGSVYLNDAAGGCPVFTHTASPGGEATILPIEAGEPLTLEMREFLRCCHTGDTPLTGIDHACYVMEIVREIESGLHAVQGRRQRPAA